MSPRGASVRAERLVRSFDNGRVRAVDSIDLHITAGEFVALVGPSGSGKSTLLGLLGGMDRPDAGRVWVDEIELGSARSLDEVRARQVGFVFQDSVLLANLSAAENVELPMYALGTRRRERRARAAELLEAVGLAQRASHLPAALSGGERQRVALARALANGAGLLLGDEPTGSLDRATGAQVLELLETLRRERGLTLVLVTHDLELAARAERRIRITDGRIASIEHGAATAGERAPTR